LHERVIRFRAAAIPAAERKLQLLKKRRHFEAMISSKP